MRIRLSTRLILAVVLIEAAMLTLLVWNSVRLINSSHAELLEQSTREQTLLLANSLAPGLLVDDRATLQDVLYLLNDKDNLVYAAVYSRDQRLLAVLGTPPPRMQQVPDSRYDDALEDGVFDVRRSIEVAGQALGELRAGYSIDAVETLTNQTRFQNTTIAGVELALSIGATILLGLWLTRHLRRLESGARALREGDLEHRITIRSRDEIGDLAGAFNRLAQHLEGTQQALQREHAALEREKRYLDTLLNGIDAVIWEADAESGRFLYVSREAEKLLGYPVTQWLEEGFRRKHIHPDDREWVLQDYRTRTRTPGSFSLDYRVFQASGRCLWIRDLCTCERSADGRTLVRGLTLDVTDEKASEARIIYLADHDALTGLFNRRRFQEELEQHITYAERYRHEGALLFLDLDQFKYVNDSFGHQQGDQFLVEVAARLSRSLRQTDLLGRLGGDEFGVLLPEADAEQARQAASAVLASLSSEQVEIFPGQAVRVSASIGVVLFPTHGTSPGELLAKADSAMYTAKEQGRNQLHLFDEEDRSMARMHAKIHWEERIRLALAHDRFVLHYQPVINLPDGSISHYEALLRMQDDDGGLIAPGSFLEVAERFGMIREIDHWVLERAIRAQAESIATGEPLRIAVNLSGRHFGSTEVLELVQRAMSEYDADPGAIIFEVTETAAVENLAGARVFIDALRGIGCRFALDDFGIGFSSFYYLKHLPVDYVKIDGTFVRNMDRDDSDAIFVRSIAELAGRLGIITIAECIERQSVLDQLRAMGVDMGQGYHLGAPAAAIGPRLRRTERAQG